MPVSVRRLKPGFHFISDIPHDPGDSPVIKQGGNSDQDKENCQTDVNRRDHDGRCSSQTEDRKNAHADGQQRKRKKSDAAEHVIDHMENSDRAGPAFAKTETDGGERLKKSEQHKRQADYENVYDRFGGKRKIQGKSIDDLFYRFFGNLERTQKLGDHGFSVGDGGSLLEDPVEGGHDRLQYKGRQDGETQLAQALCQLDDHKDR